MKTRPTRMAGAAALLAALASIVSGCLLGTQADAGQKISDIAAAHQDSSFEGWKLGDGKPFTWSEADKESMETNGLAVLQVLIEDHPEFTAGSFRPTLEVWNEQVAPKLKPLTVSSSWPKLTEAWLKEVPSEDGRLEGASLAQFNPVLTSRPELLNGDSSGYGIIRTWKTDRGGKCSASDKPYGVDVKDINITSRTAVAGDYSSAYPLLTARYDVTVHCKEGGSVTASQMRTTIQMKKENGEWRLSGSSTFAGKAQQT